MPMHSRMILVKDCTVNNLITLQSKYLHMVLAVVEVAVVVVVILTLVAEVVIVVVQKNK